MENVKGFSAKKILIVRIEKSDNNYSAYLEGIDGIVVSGSSVDEIKCRMSEALDIFIEESKELNYELPEELKEGYELIFKMDVKSLLDFYSEIFSKAGLERITGINQKQLWHYASGTRNPRPEQSLKLERALHKLGQELISIQL
jgi:predicted RNase H-like HicB family nuclease